MNQQTGSPGSDPSVGSEFTQDTREWLAEWVPDGPGQIVVGGMNLEFSGSADDRPDVFPPLTLDSMPRVRDYIALLDFVAGSGAPESLRSDLGPNGELTRLAGQIITNEPSGNK